MALESSSHKQCRRVQFKDTVGRQQSFLLVQSNNGVHRSPEEKKNCWYTSREFDDMRTHSIKMTEFLANSLDGETLQALGLFTQECCNERQILICYGKLVVQEEQSRRRQPQRSRSCQDDDTKDYFHRNTETISARSKWSSELSTQAAIRRAEIIAQQVRGRKNLSTKQKRRISIALPVKESCAPQCGEERRIKPKFQ